jgi:prepilin-type N-terminal cleavage/methylation domain-containing protein
MDALFNRVARRRRRGQGGFTLIELLVVIAVLAILAAIVIFNVVGVTNRGSTSACQTDTKSVQTASDAFYNDKLVYPNGLTSANTGGSNTTTAGSAVDIAALTPAYLHTAPGNGETFTYNDTTGTVAGSVGGGTC